MAERRSALRKRNSALQMKYDAKIHRRRSIRLHGYDYSLPGAYYLTLCAFKKQCIFGRVVEDQIYENDCGKIAREQWFESAQIRREFELDAFIVMPNHLHGILWILGPKGEHVLVNSGLAQPLDRVPGVRPLGNNRIPAMHSHSLASWAAGFKSAVTSRIRKHWNSPRAAVWQEDYFERIIRDEDELFRIREYVLSNPAHWKLDRENPEVGPGSEDEWPWNPEDGL